MSVVRLINEFNSMLLLKRSRFINRLLIAVFILPGFVCICYSQEKVELKFAKELTGKIIDGQEVREANGNVEFVQGNVKVYCNSATQYITSNRVELRGNVKLYQDTLSLFTSNANYFGDDKKAVCEGGVTLKDPNAILRADNGIYSFSDSKALFKGNVIIINPDYRITANEITYFRNNENSFAKGNVIVTTDSAVISADNIDFFRQQGKSFAYGKVKIESDSTIIHSDTATNFSNDKISVASGNVKLISLNNNAVISGNALENYEKDNFTIVKGNAKFKQIENNKDTIRIYSDTMKAFRNKPEYYVALSNTEIIRNNFLSKCQTGIYYRDSSKVSLSGNPIIWQDRIQMTGDSVYADFPGKKLQTIFVKKTDRLSDSKTSFVISGISDSINASGDSRYDQISGNDVTLKFQNEKINLIEVFKNSRSFYFLFDNGKPDGINKAEGEFIKVYFGDDEKVNRIKVEENPKGEYIPENLLNTIPLTLPGFNLRKDKPVTRD